MDVVKYNKFWSDEDGTNLNENSLLSIRKRWTPILIKQN